MGGDFLVSQLKARKFQAPKLKSQTNPKTQIQNSKPVIQRQPYPTASMTCIIFICDVTNGLIVW
jgi:hypothetical protein